MKMFNLNTSFSVKLFKSNFIRNKTFSKNTNFLLKVCFKVFVFTLSLKKRYINFLIKNHFTASNFFKVLLCCCTSVFAFLTFYIFISEFKLLLYYSIKI